MRSSEPSSLVRQPCELDALMQDKLEVHCREQLSAMLDGALAPDEARFLLRRLQHDQELASCWERWQLCGDLMRGAAPAVLPRDFAQRVSSALAAEQEAQHGGVAAQSVGSGRSWVHWAGGATIAASMAVAALFVVQRSPQLSPSAPRSGAPQLVTTTTPTIPAPATARSTGSDTAPTTSAAVTVAHTRTDLARPDLARAPELPLLDIAKDADDALIVAEVPRRAVVVAAQQPHTSPSQQVRQAEPVPGPTVDQLEMRRRALAQSAIGMPAIDPNVDAGAMTEFRTESPSRPWPRSTLVESGGSLNVGYDGFSGGHGGHAEFDMFRASPQTLVQDAAQP